MKTRAIMVATLLLTSAACTTPAPCTSGVAFRPGMTKDQVLQTLDMSCLGPVRPMAVTNTNGTTVWSFCASPVCGWDAGSCSMTFTNGALTRQDNVDGRNLDLTRW